jgi:hypothetical protein
MNNDQIDDDVSPASIIPKTIVWNDQLEKVFKFTKSGTFTSNIILPKSFTANIYFRVLEAPGSFTIGISDRYIEYDTKNFLGGDMGKGNWAIAGSSVIGEEGSWNYQGKSFGQGDTLTLEFNDDTIKYKVNGVENEYSYRFKTPNLDYYLGCSVTSSCELEILD